MERKRVFELDYNYCPTCITPLNFIDDILSCSECEFKFYNNPTPVVSALVENNQEILLIKRKRGSYRNYWALPGGIIDFLETPEAAIRRELKEETGLDALTTELIDAHLIIYSPRGLYRKPSHTSIDLVYRTTVTGDTHINDDEISAIRYFPVSVLPKKIAFGHEEIILKFIRQR